MNQRYANAIAKINAHLDELMGLLSMAQATGRLEEWSIHYTKGYMLKLRTLP